MSDHRNLYHQYDSFFTSRGSFNLREEDHILLPDGLGAAVSGAGGDLHGVDLSFTGCLKSSADYHVLERAFDLSCSSPSESFFGPGVDVAKPATTAIDTAFVGLLSPGRAASCGTGGAGSGTRPATPNTSASSSSTEPQGEEDSGRCKDKDAFELAKGVGDVDGVDKSKKAKPRKKGEKRQSEPRFAFMTKSEVDHLEDGYRWRKYGQKAVKNSPYPRSYYRCTALKCSVKKRVERSYQDPSVVMTTYEGQHTHQSPGTLRGSSHIPAPSPPTPVAGLCSDLLLRHLPSPHSDIMQQSETSHRYLKNRFPVPAAQQLQLPDYGLLQDIIPSFIHNGQ